VLFNQEWADALLDFAAVNDKTRHGDRGRYYALNNRVSNIILTESNEIIASVQGTRSKPYKSTLFLNGEEIEAFCTCPVSLNCKHTYALTLVILYGAWQSGSRQAMQGKKFFPTSWNKSCRLPKMNIYTNLRKLFEIIPKESEIKWWINYINAETHEAKAEILHNAIYARINKINLPFFYLDRIERQIIKIKNPIELFQMFEKEISGRYKYYYEEYTDPDPELAEFLDSKEARDINSKYQHEKGLKNLLRWLDPYEFPEYKSGVSGHIDLKWLIRPYNNGIQLLYFQLLLNSAESEYGIGTRVVIKNPARDRRLFSQDFSFEDKQLINWLSNSPEVSSRKYSMRQDAREKQEGIIPVFDILKWISQWGHRNIIKWENGSIVKYNPEPLHLGLDHEENSNQTVWVINYPSEEKKSPALLSEKRSSIIVEGNAPYKLKRPARIFLREGDIIRPLFTGYMPFDIFCSALDIKNIPTESFRESTAGLNLIERLTLEDNPESKSLTIDYIPVMPILEFRLSKRKITLTAFARSDDGYFFIRKHSGKWIRTRKYEDEGEVLEGVPLNPLEANINPDDDLHDFPEKLNANIHALYVAPSKTDIEPIDVWIEKLLPGTCEGIINEYGYASFRWRADAKKISNLLELWQERPSHATWLGNKSFRELVCIRKLPKWNIRIESSGIDWLYVSYETEKEMDDIPIKDLGKILAEEGEKLVALPGVGNFRRDELLEFKKTLDMLNSLGLEAEPGRQRLHAIQLAGKAGESLLDMEKENDRLKEFAEKSKSLLKNFKGIPESDVDKNTKKWLRPYQRDGVNFLNWACNTFGGAIIADDMGLGKTLQVLAVLTALQKTKKTRMPSLAVCPASVIHNWQREAERFTPNLKILLVQSGKERFCKYEDIKNYDLIIINYSLVRRDIEILKEHSWLLICVDEAQTIKNPRAGITRALKKFDSKYRIALTGTPIENRLLDIWSIVDFVSPGHLHSIRTFEQKMKTQDEKDFSHLLRARLRPLLIRRLKKEVAPELPPRIEERIDCTMTPKQRKLYLSELKRTRALLKGIKEKKISGKGRFQILAALTRLRQICCDPELVNHKSCGSGKMDAMMEILEKLLSAGHKILLFSQFVKMLNLIKTRLKNEKIPFYLLTGQTKKRKELVEKYESDPTPGVFLISLKAGGLGLNLVSASHVIVFDPWWNPAIESQAIDRTHRIGQDKTVVAYRLVMEETVEDRILELQEKKKGLVKNILEEESFNRTLSKEDFDYLVE
jgi:superfamily II DNA or RNA helicase